LNLSLLYDGLVSDLNPDSNLTAVDSYLDPDSGLRVRDSTDVRFITSPIIDVRWKMTTYTNILMLAIAKNT